MSCVDKSPPVIAWKGKTFHQVTSIMKRNHNTNHAIQSFLLSNPVTKYYRREIAESTEQENGQTTCGNERTSVSIDELNRPNGYSIPATEGETIYGIQGTLDPLIPNDQTVVASACDTCNTASVNCLTSSSDSQNVCFTEESKARRRCRSAGMIQNRFKVANQNDNQYFTDTKQYLTSRNRLFSQNQYNYIRQGLPNVTPGSAQSQNNVYSANGLSHCPTFTISNEAGNNQFRYLWVSNSDQSLKVPDGQYDIYTYNQAVQQALIQKKHYYINKNDFTIYSLIRFSFDTEKGLVTLQLLPHPDLNQYNPGAAWGPVLNDNTPSVTIFPNGLDQGLGLQPQVYPATPSTTPVTITAQSPGLLKPNYVTVVYKPSNYKFAKQGGVSSSSYIQRKKVDNVNTAAALSGPPNFGQEVANELAYNTPFVGYTRKDKVGFPNTAAPVVTPTGQLRSCRKYIYRYG